ncbi:MAG: YopN family type III secretion system gatekeeper subunit [Chlamydiae bacterium]|nr:YopN family type III secretion system gatekeeper subunit [Chlamydiota bacterium]
MSDDRHIQGVSGLSKAAERLRMQQLRDIQQAADIEVRVDSSEAELQQWCELAAFNPLAIARRFETIDRRIRRPDVEKSSQESDDEVIEFIEAVEKVAEDFTQKNPELKTRVLTNLLSLFGENDTPESILSKVLATYPDQYLADEALNYLVQVTHPNSKLGIHFRRAKELLFEKYNREIIAGRNINQEAQAFAKQGLGTPTNLRDLYRDVTGNPREAVNLFDELNNLFSYEKLKTAIKFILHAIGADLKSKGTSIDRNELQRLFSEARNMQAIIGIYRFFQLRMEMIAKLFSKEHLTLPQRLNFELLAKQFVVLLQEKYPSPERVLKLAQSLGISAEVAAQVIIFTQYRDAIRGVSPRLFKSTKHRQDLLMILIETISELDDLLEEEEEKAE